MKQQASISTGSTISLKTNMKLPAFAEVWAELSEKRPASFEELSELEEEL